MLDMKCAPKDGTVVVVCTQRGMWLANWSVSGWYGTAGCVRIDDEILGWRPIGDKWLDPAVVPPIEGVDIWVTFGGAEPPRLWLWRGSGAFETWEDSEGRFTPFYMVKGWLPLPGEDGA